MKEVLSRIRSFCVFLLCLISIRRIHAVNKSHTATSDVPTFHCVSDCVSLRVRPRRRRRGGYATKAGPADRQASRRSLAYIQEHTMVKREKNCIITNLGLVDVKTGTSNAMV